MFLGAGENSRPEKLYISIIAGTLVFVERRGMWIDGQKHGFEWFFKPY